MMHKMIALLALIGSLTAVSALSSGAEEMLLSEAWEGFKKEYGKTYATPEEEENRRMIFVENLEHAAEWNKLEGNEIFGITQFSDIGLEEFRALYLNHRNSGQRKNLPVRKPALRSTPSSFDWRDTDGVVTPVKNQAQCGSCWAFSATETIESAWALAGNELTEFSVEQIVQCDKTSYGCNGGFTESAYDYVEKAGGLATEADYPYTSGTGRTGQCSSDFEVAGGDISGYEYATEPCNAGSCSNQDEDTMAANLASNQPVSVCVDASKWSLYRGGVMTSSSCSSNAFAQDHCVQATGFADIDTRNGYWIVRNSWAATWGERGYIYLAYGDNTCGVADDATTVTF